jgi:hypothetical protein
MDWLSNIQSGKSMTAAGSSGVRQGDVDGSRGVRRRSSEQREQHGPMSATAFDWTWPSQTATR